MRRSKLISLWLTILVFAIFAVYFIANRSQFRPLLDINFWLLFFIAACDIGMIFINGLFTKFVLRPFNKFIPMLESFYVSLISSVGNFFAPVGAGFGFRAVYLKQRHGVSYGDYISTLSGNYIIVFLVNSFFGFASLLMLRDHSSRQHGVLMAAFGVVFLSSLALSLVRLPNNKTRSHKNKYINSVVQNVSRVARGWSYIASHRTLMLKLIGLTFFGLGLSALNTYLIIHSLHLGITLAPLILFSVLGSLSLFINITPANLGVKEAIYLFSSTVLGFSTAQILSIALIDRSVMFLVLAALWGISAKLKPSMEL